MGKNDVILIDNMVDQLVQSEDATSSERADAFQRMAIEFVLGHITPTTEDLEEGIVDGANDGGIDGFFISVNGSLVTDSSSIMWPRTGIELEVWICTCKHQDTFSPENSWRVPIPVQTQEPPCGTSAVLTTTCATTEALA